MDDQGVLWTGRGGQDSRPFRTNHRAGHATAGFTECISRDGFSAQSAGTLYAYVCWAAAALGRLLLRYDKAYRRFGRGGRPYIVVGSDEFCVGNIAQVQSDV